jgi:hypothetical protein
MGLFIRQPAASAERRGAVRASVRLTAMLTYGGISVSCTVRNISTTGAAILLPDGKDVPDEVTLVIVGKPEKRPARVVWRLAPLIALQFKPN